MPFLQELQIALVSLDHLLDHLAADGTGFTGSQVAVVALLQVNADFAGSFHLELIHGVSCFGNIDLIVVLGTHILHLLKIDLFGYRNNRFPRRMTNIQLFLW